MTEDAPLYLKWFQFCRLLQDSFAYSAIFEVKGIGCFITKSSSLLAIYLLTKYIILFCLHYYISTLKLILKLCCAYRTGLTPFYYANAHTVDLKDGDFRLFT